MEVNSSTLQDNSSDLLQSVPKSSFLKTVPLFFLMLVHTNLNTLIQLIKRTSAQMPLHHDQWV